MAVSSSLALLFLVSAVLSARSAATGGDTIQNLCAPTSYAESCSKTLTPSVRGLAETAFAFLAKEGPLLLAETDREYQAAVSHGNQTLIACFGVLNGNLGPYVANLCGLEPERGDAERAEARGRLESLLSTPSSSGVSCGDEDLFKEKPLIGKVYNYEQMMQVTLDLMNTAVAQT